MNSAGIDADINDTIITHIPLSRTDGSVSSSYNTQPIIKKHSLSKFRIVYKMFSAGTVTLAGFSLTLWS